MVKHNNDSGTHQEFAGKIDVHTDSDTGDVLPDAKSFAETVRDYGKRREEEAAKTKAIIGWTPKLAANWHKGIGPKKKRNPAENN